MTATDICVKITVAVILEMEFGEMNMRNFSILTDEKRNMVLNGAFTCFAKDGYKKTAMSEIAETARVSKASLFQYFGTKKNLYLFLFDFACKKILAKAGEGTADFFECIELSIRLKLEVTNQYPNMFEFLTSIAYEDDLSIVAELHSIHGDAINKWVKRLTASVEWDRFLPEISQEEAFSLVSWITDGYSKTYGKMKTQEEIMTDIGKYLKLIKKATYKEEFQ